MNLIKFSLFLSLFFFTNACKSQNIWSVSYGAGYFENAIFINNFKIEFSPNKIKTLSVVLSYFYRRKGIQPIQKIGTTGIYKFAFINPEIRYNYKYKNNFLYLGFGLSMGHIEYFITKKFVGIQPPNALNIRKTVTKSSGYNRKFLTSVGFKIKLTKLLNKDIYIEPTCYLIHKSGANFVVNVTLIL